MRAIWCGGNVDNGVHSTPSFNKNAPFSEEPIKAPSTKNGSCPGQLHGVTTWLRHGSYCYLPVTNTMKWQDARLHCAKYGPASTLVSIHSESENQFVHDNMPKSTYSGGAAWIGLYRHKKGNTSIKLICFVVKIYPVTGKIIPFDDVIVHDVIKLKHFPRYWLFVRGIYMI